MLVLFITYGMVLLSLCFAVVFRLIGTFIRVIKGVYNGR